MADEPPTETETDSGEEERLPWLKRADDEPEEGAGTGRPLAYAAGAAVALVAVVGLGYAVLQRPHDQGTTDEVQTNLAGLESDQALIQGQAGGNQSAPAPVPSSHAKPASRAPAHHPRPAKTATAPAAVTTRATSHTPVTPPKRAAAERPSPPKRAAVEHPSPPARRAARPAPSPARRPAHREAPVPVTGPGTIIQLGAFSTAARADQAWLSLSQARHLSRFPHRVERAQVHGRTVYRLRVLVSGRTGECGLRSRCMVVRQGR